MEAEIVSDEDRRFIARWAADCAERVLPLFEAAAPADPRPRAAIGEARAYASGGQRTAGLRDASLAALAAAREAGSPLAAAAARAAGYAAGAPYIHSLATPHQSKHAVASAVYAARARDLAAGDETGAGDDEIRWAIEHAPPAVGEVLGRMPVFVPGRSRLDLLRDRLEAALRH